MDCSKTGALILKLRKEKGLTQAKLAEIMNISDKTVSKWERGLGCPDVSLLKELSDVLGVNIEEILSGGTDTDEITGGSLKNMKSIVFYVCPSCGNIITSTNGTAKESTVISCCGKKLMPLEAKKEDEEHMLNTTTIENELYISSAHKMKKEHYISFAALISNDRITTVKTYPEWNLQIRIPKIRHGRLLWYCTVHGLFYKII